jgi:hypothetical protein
MINPSFTILVIKMKILEILMVKQGRIKLKILTTNLLLKQNLISSLTCLCIKGRFD